MMSLLSLLWRHYNHHHFSILDVFEGTYKGTKVAIKTLKNVTPQATEEFLAEADVMRYVSDGVVAGTG